MSFFPEVVRTWVVLSWQDLFSDSNAPPRYENSSERSLRWPWSNTCQKVKTIPSRLVRRHRRDMRNGFSNATGSGYIWRETSFVLKVEIIKINASRWNQDHSILTQIYWKIYHQDLKNYLIFCYTTMFNKDLRIATWGKSISHLERWPLGPFQSIGRPFFKIDHESRPW